MAIKHKKSTELNGKTYQLNLEIPAGQMILVTKEISREDGNVDLSKIIDAILPDSEIERLMVDISDKDDVVNMETFAEWLNVNLEKAIDSPLSDS